MLLRLGGTGIGVRSGEGPADVAPRGGALGTRSNRRRCVLSRPILASLQVPDDGVGCCNGGALDRQIMPSKWSRHAVNRPSNTVHDALAHSKRPAHLARSSTRRKHRASALEVRNEPVPWRIPTGQVRGERRIQLNEPQSIRPAQQAAGSAFGRLAADFYVGAGPTQAQKSVANLLNIGHNSRQGAQNLEFARAEFQARNEQLQADPEYATGRLQRSPCDAASPPDPASGYDHPCASNRLPTAWCVFRFRSHAANARNSRLPPTRTNKSAPESWGS